MTITLFRMILKLILKNKNKISFENIAINVIYNIHYRVYLKYVEFGN